MSVSLRIHENPFKSARVNFTTKEQVILDSYSVKTATTAAEQAWKSVKKDTLAFAKKLKKVQRVMVKGNSPKSLFSKWLKSVGIPRATAYWTLKQTGNGSGKKQPSVKQLLSKRDKLAKKLTTAKKEDKQELKDQINSLNKRVSDKQELVKNQIKSAFKEVRDKISKVSWFSEHSDEQAPLLKTVAEEAQSMVAELKSLNLDWKQSGDLLAKVLSAISTGRDPFDVVRPLLAKKPAASVRTTAEHRPTATA